MLQRNNSVYNRSICSVNAPWGECLFLNVVPVGKTEELGGGSSTNKRPRGENAPGGFFPKTVFSTHPPNTRASVVSTVPTFTWVFLWSAFPCRLIVCFGVAFVLFTYESSLHVCAILAVVVSPAGKPWIISRSDFELMERLSNNDATTNNDEQQALTTTRIAHCIHVAAGRKGIPRGYAYVPSRGDIVLSCCLPMYFLVYFKVFPGDTKEVWDSAWKQKQKTVPNVFITRSAIFVLGGDDTRTGALP